MFHACIEGLKKNRTSQNGGGFLFGFDFVDKRYDPKPEVSIENEKVKVLWNMKFQTEKSY